MIALRVKPQARRSALLGWHGEALKIAVRAAPERGRANDEVRALLARVLGVAIDDVVLEAGAASQNKRVRVRDLTNDEVRARIDAALSTTRDRGGRE